MFLCLAVIVPASGQNTKGDKPARESRFRLPFKKKPGGRQKQKTPSAKRVKANGKSFSNSGVAGIFSKKGKSISARHKNVFSQRGRFVKGYSRQPKHRVDHPGRPVAPIVSSKPQSRQKAWRGDISGHRIRARSKPASIKSNVYPQSGPLIHRPTGARRKQGDRPVSNRRDLRFASQHQGKKKTVVGKRRLVPQSISGSFIARKRNDNWKRFPQQKKKGEVAFTNDITGRKLRRKNFESKKPEVFYPGPTYRGGRTGDRTYRGASLRGNTRSATRTGRAWKGNFAGGQLIGRNFSSKGRVESVGRRYRRTAGSASTSGERRTGRLPLPPRVPGIGSSGIGYSGRIKGHRPEKGGGSVSGRVWNNRQQPVAGRGVGPGDLRAGAFQGNIKSRRPAKGGKSISGRVWNNRQSPIPVHPPSQTGMKAGGYPGRQKRFQVQPGFIDQGEEYGGHLKGARRAPKPAGSVSGKVWNNRQRAIEGKGVGPGDLRTALYQGNIKAKRPVKGGKSISGKVWNNKQSPIPVRTPPAGAEQAGKFPGKIKRFSVQPGFSDQGEEFTGVIKRPWWRRSYSRNPNAHEKAIKQESPHQTTYQVGNLHVAVKTRKYVRNKKLVDEATPKLSPTKATYETGELQVKVKTRKYVKNPNQADEAIRKLKPTENTYAVDGLQVKVKQPAIGKKPHAVKGSLPGVKPSKETVKASQYARGVRRDWDYIHNPSSAKEALRVREPGKAFAKATDYQGNIKMRKFKLFEKSNLHPDAQFVKTNKNNVKEERGFFTNIKLWWAKTFRKNETQPDHLKDKGHKPRYDKGEQGLWND